MSASQADSKRQMCNTSLAERSVASKPLPKATASQPCKQKRGRQPDSPGSKIPSGQADCQGSQKAQVGRRDKYVNWWESALIQKMLETVERKEALTKPFCTCVVPFMASLTSWPGPTVGPRGVQLLLSARAAIAEKQSHITVVTLHVRMYTVYCVPCIWYEQKTFMSKQVYNIIVYGT